MVTLRSRCTGDLVRALQFQFRLLVPLGVVADERVLQLVPRHVRLVVLGVAAEEPGEVLASAPYSPRQHQTGQYESDRYQRPGYRPDE